MLLSCICLICDNLRNLRMEKVAINVHKSSLFELWKEAGRPIDVRIDGASMWPLIRPKDSVCLRLMDGHELKTGDLLAFWKDGAIVVHRFIGKKREKGAGWLCQKGDNLSGWSWIPEDEVIGRVESIKGRGKVIDMNTRPWIWINRVMGISCLLRKWEAIGSGLTLRDYEHFYEYTSSLQKNGESGIDISCGLSGFLLKMPEEYQEDDIWCPVGRRLVIDVNGDAYPCVLMMEDEFRLGNAFDDSLDKIIHSDTMIAVCQALSERRHKIKKCSGCNWRNLCQAGCMGLALDNKGTIWDTDNFCDYRSRAYKEAFDRVLKIDD